MAEETTVPAVAQEPAAAPAAAAQPQRRGGSARVYVNASYNNTVITITDLKGGVIAWATAGSLGFGGPKKATPFASSKVVAALTEKLKQKKVTDLEILVKGMGGGRDSALRSFVAQGFTVSSFKDVTPIPHNGPRAKKVRRT